MNSRYSIARAKGRTAYDEAVKEDEDLLAAYGLRLLSIQSGITFAVEDKLRGPKIKPWDMVEMTAKAWETFRPILLRLQEAEKELEEAKKSLRLCETGKFISDAKA